LLYSFSSTLQIWCFCLLTLKWGHDEIFFINLHRVFSDCIVVSLLSFLCWGQALLFSCSGFMFNPLSCPPFFLASYFIWKFFDVAYLHYIYVAYKYEPNLHNLVCCRTVEVPSSRIVVIEGIYALNEKLRPFLDLRISVNGGVHFDLVKRVLRDIQRAGQEPSEIIHQVSETVCFSNL